MTNLAHEQRFSRSGKKSKATDERLLLLRLMQHQEHKLHLEKSDGGIESLRGALDQVRWEDLDFVVATAKVSIERAEILPAGALTTDVLLEQGDTGWNPVIELRITDPSIGADALRKAKTVADLCLSKISRGRDIMSLDFREDSLRQEELTAVETVVTEQLNQMGGRKIQEPIEVSLDGVAHARVEGRYADRFDHSNFTPVPVELRGRFRGFDVDDEAFFFHAEGVGRLIVFYGKQTVDLEQVTGLSKARSACVIRTHTTTKKAGGLVHAFVSITSIDEPYA